MSVIVDDSDPMVQYWPLGGWSTSGQGPEFETTAHASATLGDTATLVFEGISIGVYGSIDSSSGHSSLNFSVDGVDLGSYEAPLLQHIVYNQLFWKSPVFNETQHTLVVTVSHTPQTPTFLDYFIYNTTSTAGKTLLIDDTDGRVTYSPDGWESSDSSDNCLESTQHASASVGSWVALPFNGTGVSLFGTPGQPGFNVSIVVDRSQPVLSISQTSDNQLFNTNGLTSGPHTINITVLEGKLGIDYFLVSNASSSVPAAPQSATPQSGSAPTGSALSGSSKTPLPIAAILGGVIGGLVILVSLLAIIIWKRRRRARRNNTQPGFFVSPRWVGSDVDDLSIIAPRAFQPFDTTEPPPGVSVLPQSVESGVNVAPQPFQPFDTKEPQPSVSVSRQRAGSDVDNLSIVAPSFQASERSVTTEPPPPYPSND
ncbi:hypothetical protein MSAN_00286200 [Mycena sanguinolenta]|uniref:Transmembrane protein n=1 Tax=Mycena sanguinolenta TaxID=230812 RepID=A0A8H7DJ10_9AGAR|nr:hypothetical protein MSAN_00286200 [Mycena sanguinolenta]